MTEPTKRGRLRKTDRKSNARFLEAPVPIPEPGFAPSVQIDPFTPDDLKTFLGAAGLQDLWNFEAAEWAAFTLNREASMFAIRRIQAERDSPTNVQGWALQIEGYARSLLFALGVDPSQAPGVGAFSFQGQWLRPGVVSSEAIKQQAARAFPFPEHEAQEVAKASDFDPWPIINHAPAAVAALMLVAQQAADRAVMQKKRGRTSEPGRLDLFWGTTAVYQQITGLQAGVSRSPSAAERDAAKTLPGGPCVRFHQALLQTLSDRLPSNLTEQDPGLRSALTLSEVQIGEAINSVNAARRPG